MSKFRPSKPNPADASDEAPAKPERKRRRRARADDASPSPGRRRWLLPLSMALAGMIVGSLLTAYWPFRWGQAAEVEDFLEHYFVTWSAGDMQAYEHCFHPRASIYFIDEQRQLSHPIGLQAFVQSQREVQTQPGGPQQEVPTWMDIQIIDDAAQAQVGWQLMRADGDVFGTDYFTLMHDDQGWRIIALAFQEDRK